MLRDETVVWSGDASRRPLSMTSDDFEGKGAPRRDDSASPAVPDDRR